MGRGMDFEIGFTSDDGRLWPGIVLFLNIAGLQWVWKSFFPIDLEYLHNYMNERSLQAVVIYTNPRVYRFHARDVFTINRR